MSIALVVYNFAYVTSVWLSCIYAEELVAGAYLARDGNGDARALRCLADGVAVVVVDLGGREVHHARRGAGH